MIEINNASISAPVRKVVSKAELYNGSAELANTYSYNDLLKELTIERVGEGSKFFGFGVSQKLNIKLLNAEKPNVNDYFKVYFGSDDSNYINNFPCFYVTESHRDEKTNELSITAYDVVKKFDEHTVAELGLAGGYTIEEFAAACGSLFSLSLEIRNLEGKGNFTLAYENGANFEGTETIREALNAVAEATQTIYYINGSKLIFKRLGANAADLQITKADYFELDSGENRRLQAICSTNELGDSITASIATIGTTQFIRDNPFLEFREDLATILDNSISAIGGFSINQFECNWRGNYGLEVGDLIELTTKDNTTAIGYVLDDVIKYNGALSQTTRWAYESSEAETATNPTTLGEKLKQTFARVDKANKKIDLVASESGANTEAIAALEMNTESISLSVTNVEKSLTEKIESANNELSTISKKVDMQLTSEDVTITVQNEMANGVSTVKTGKGFEFNDSGLTVKDINPDSNKEIETTISNNGMVVNVEGAEKLKANDEGVKAVDLHATTFLIIGNNSRFEDYKGNRTACFWIGG